MSFFKVLQGILLAVILAILVTSVQKAVKEMHHYRYYYVVYRCPKGYGSIFSRIDGFNGKYPIWQEQKQIIADHPDIDECVIVYITETTKEQFDNTSPGGPGYIGSWKK